MNDNPNSLAAFADLSPNLRSSLHRQLPLPAPGHPHAQQQQQQQQQQQPQHSQQQQQQQQHHSLPSAYPSNLPSTPHNHASPGAPASSPSVKISPEGINNLAASVQSGGSPFSGANSVISPTGSTFSAGHRSDMSAGGGGSGDGSNYSMSAALAFSNAMSGGMQSSQGQQQQQGQQGLTVTGMQQLGMEVDFSNSLQPQGGPSSSASTPSTAQPPAYFYPSSNQNSVSAQLTQSSLPPPSHPAPTLAHPPRHHPYAHPSRPSINTQASSSAAIPLYLSTPSPASHQPSPGPPSAGSDGSTNTFPAGLGLAPVPPQPQRVHSAPPHILTLSTSGLEGFTSSPLASAVEPDSSNPNSMEQQQQRLFSAVQQAFGDSEGMLQSGVGGTVSAPAGPGTPINGLGPAFGTGMGMEGVQQQQQQHQLQQQQQQAPAPPSSAHGGDEDRTPGYNEPATQAISLLKKRLPIMEAALSSSVREAGNDEEEIWKGIEGAYEELKRIMGDRKDARRGSTSGSSSMRPFSTSMDLETPVTPVERERPHTGFISPHPPPLQHSHTSPDVSFAQQQNAANAAHLAAIAQAQVVQHQQQVQQLQAEADRARAEADQRARAEEEARAQMEAESRLRAEAEADAAAQHALAEQAQREANQYQQMLQADQLRQAREKLHQDMLENAPPGAPQTLPNPPVPVYPSPTPQPTQFDMQQQFERERFDQHQQQVFNEQQHRFDEHQLEQQRQQEFDEQQQQQHQQQQQQQHRYEQELQQIQLEQQTPQPLPQQLPQHQQQQQPPPPPQQQQQLPNPGQLLFATPQQAQAYALQMQLQNGGLPPNGAVTLIPVHGLPPGSIPPSSGLPQPAPIQGQQPPTLAGHFPVGFDANAGGDLAMLQQMHLNALAYSSVPVQQAPPPPPPDNVDPSSISGSPFAPSNSVAPSAIAPPPPSLTPSNALPLPPQPATFAAIQANSGPGPVRPSRSRAASQSGYTSSGSRSRAASGSGYQVLLESRSRTASTASSVYHPYEHDEEDDYGDEGGDLEHDIDVNGDGPAKLRGSSQMGAASAGVDAETSAKMDPVFLDFLADICSNLEATDSKGDPIHQTLMAKKMEKLDQSHDFRPFKFRIQAFTTAFAERLTASGAFGGEVPVKKVRQYLWAQPHISRFNDDGKKAKSKGNHIWTVEAKKMPDRQWLFREFTRCIKGQAPPIAFVGVPWTWQPRVWDPQCSSAALDAAFMSPSLPPWLSWEDNVLSGEPPESDLGQDFEIEAVATFQMANKVHQLKATTSFRVASANDTDDPAAASSSSRLRPHDGDDEQKPITSNNSSQQHSPDSALYRSPSLSSSGFLDPLQTSQLRQHSLNNSGESSYAQSGLVSPANGLEAAFAPLDAQLPDPSSWPSSLQEQQLQQQQQQQQQQQHDIVMDVQVGGDAQSALEQQAALHQHYVTMQQGGQPFNPVPASSMSYAPAPELVSNALRNAADSYNPGYTSVDPGMISHAPSGTGTPSVFALHDMSQQPPFTLDPSTL